jgi:hypothetical protein
MKVKVDKKYLISKDWDETPESCWNKWWKDILIKNGKIDKEQLKKELHDASLLEQEVIYLYSGLSGGNITKPFTYPHEVYSLYEQDLMDNYIHKDDLKDLLKNIKRKVKLRIECKI